MSDGQGKILVSLKNPRVVAGLFLILMVSAYCIPRVAFWHGITMSVKLGDFVLHQNNLDLIYKNRILDKRQRGSSFAENNDAYFRTYNADRWPKGVYYFAQLWVGLFGPRSIWTTQVTNLLFSLVLAAGLLGLGTVLGSLRIGIWSALLAMLCPALFAHTWYFSLSYPMIAMIVAGLFLLWKTDHFTHTRYVLAFSIWSTLGCYVKYNYLLYLIGPCLVCVIIGLIKGAQRRRIVLHLFLAIFVTAALSYALMGADIEALWDTFVNHLTGSVNEKKAFPGYQAIRLVAHQK